MRTSDDTFTMERRRLLVAGGSILAGAVFLSARQADAAASAGQKRSKPAAAKKDAGQGEEDVSPAEDLMREHGVLNRILLIYDESVRRLDAGAADVPSDVITGAADIVRRFIEDYYEKLEETHLFPRFERAKTLTDLVATLRAQHQAGRRVTDLVTQLATAQNIKNAGERPKLIAAIRQFNRMYRPHEAREDTVLFPAFRKIVSKNEYASLGEDFEKQEHKLFGEDGFESMVDKVAGLEKRLGIYDLGQFTPR